MLQSKSLCGVTLQYNIEGDGYPVILMHGWGCNHTTVQSIERLLSPHFKVYNLDFPGFGGSSIPPSIWIKPKRPLKYYLKVYSFKLWKKVLPLVIGKKQAEKTIENYRRKSGSADYNALTGIMRNIMVKVVNEDLKAVLPKIQCPVLLLWGKNDTATPLRDARIMEKLIPDAGLVAFDDAGHYSFLDKPYEFNTVLQNFLQDDIKRKS